MRGGGEGARAHPPAAAAPPLQIDDPRPNWAGYGAVLFGNVLLAGIVPTNALNGLNPADVEKVRGGARSVS